MTCAVEIPALDGRNPLGFLAALGLLNVLNEAGAQPTALSFSDRSGAAIVRSSHASLDEITEKLESVVASAAKETSIVGIDAHFPLRAEAVPTRCGAIATITAS